MVAILGVVLASPALFGGIGADDFVHRTKLLGLAHLGQEGSPVWELFRFVTPESSGALFEAGILPWWSDPDLRLAFLRPLSSATHVLDYRLWPENYLLQHAHSLAWYGLAVFLAARLYRQVSGSLVVAGLAAWMFAAEDAHALPVAWLANRNALLPLVFGLLTLLAHIRWRKESEHRLPYIALLVFPLALASGEAALGALAYIGAWEVCLGPGRGLRRLTPLWPYLLWVGLWRLLYEAWGFGAQGSDMYLDPGSEPLVFVAGAAERLPLLLFSQFSQIPADPWALLPLRGQRIFSLVGTLGCVLVGWILWPSLKSREARFWAMGMGLSLVPLCAAFPMDRLLTFAGIGAFGWLACALGQAGFLGAEPPQMRRSRRWGLGGLLFLHAILVLLWMPVRAGVSLKMFQPVQTLVDSLTTEESLSEQTLVWVNGMDLVSAYLPLMRLDEGEVYPRRLATLASLNENHLTRIDEDTLELRAVGGFYPNRGDRMCRALRAPFTVGERVERPDFEAEVIQLQPDGRPEVVRFHFRVPLEDPSLRWITLRNFRVMPFTPPPVGETVVVPAFLPWGG
jgi:hypothetical protein